MSRSRRRSAIFEKLNRREFLHKSALGSAGLLAASRLGCDGPPSSPFPESDSGAGPNFPPTRPNIIYIFTDQHRGDALGASGHPVVQSPNLDRLASEAITFGRCYTNAPLCRPARASMMTGLFVHEHKVWNNMTAANSMGPSHVRRLRDEAGYLTAVIGKTHLHLGQEHLDTYGCLLRDWGFERSFELTGPGQTATIPSRYSDWLTSSTLPGQQDKYMRYQDYISNYVDLFQTPWATPPPDIAPWDLTTRDHLDSYTGRVAADWLRLYDDERPFYLQVNFPGPHDPFNATSEFRDRYDLADPAWPEAILVHPSLRTNLIKRSIDFQNVTQMTEEEQRALALNYFAKVTLIDSAIGEILSVLEERGMLDNTWVIYGSDHGEMLGDHYLAQKAVFYESAVRIPCILRPPKGREPKKAMGLCDSTDVTATILDIAGVDSGSCRGHSLIPQMEGEYKEEALREWVLSEVHHHAMLRDERYKLIFDYLESEAVGFFDLEADPEELVNRINMPDAQTKISEMVLKLRDIIESHS